MLVAQRIVYKGVVKEGEPIKADIYNVMIKSVKQSSCLSNRRHKVALEQNDQKQKQGEKKNKKNESTAAKIKCFSRWTIQLVPLMTKLKILM